MNERNIPCLCPFLMFLLLGQHCAAVRKQWLPNTNWNNLANWNKARVPCHNDYVKLNNGISLTVSLRNSQSVKSLSLPMNGELIFFDNSELSFAGEQGEASVCEDSGDIRFLVSAHDWYNPYNWKEITHNKQSADIPSSSIILHMDSVPCVHDSVVFPQHSSFKVKSDKPITVATISLFGQEQTSKNFKDYYSIGPGSLQFNFTDSTNLTTQQCSDQTGCACGYLKFSETICSFVNCVKPACAEAILPEGSCCATCGVVLELSLAKEFELDAFKHLLLNVSWRESNNVNVAVSKTEKGSVQVVVADQGNGEKAHIAAHHLKEQIVSGKVNSTVVPLAIGISLLLLFLVTVGFLIFRRTQRTESLSLPILDDGFDLELEEMDEDKELEVHYVEEQKAETACVHG